MRGRVALTVLAAGAALLVGAAPAHAGKAVSIDVGTIAVREQLLPGGVYHLPSFGVRNPGTEMTAYEIGVSYVDGQEGLRPPAAWFTFEPPSFDLAVGASRAVATTLEIPADAEPGSYSALIGPQIVGDGTGAQVGAGAAARLTFTVQPSSALDALWRQILRFLAENPWVWVVAVLLVVLALVFILRRRFNFSVSRRP